MYYPIFSLNTERCGPEITLYLELFSSSVISFEQVKDNSQFNDDFIQNYNEETSKGYFLEVDVQYTKKDY